jgi:hypothetical protein
LSREPERRGFDLVGPNVQLSVGQHRQPFRFAGAGRWAADVLLDQPSNDDGREQRVAGGDDSNGVGELLRSYILGCIGMGCG